MPQPDAPALFPFPPVHPVAELFPMLPDDELEDLAADIKRNGLVHPIVLDADGVLIDGRNRLAACRLMEIEPRFTTLEKGQDPVAYILSTNVNRRHLNAGQRAMAAAKARLLSSQTTRAAAASCSTSQARVWQASLVVEYVPELSGDVMVGTLSLNDAYAAAQARKKALEEREAAAEREARQLNELRRTAPDLAELVEEGRLSLAVAVAEWQNREALERERRERLTGGFATATSTIWAMLKDSPARVAESWLPEANKLGHIPEFKQLWTADGLRRLGASLDQLADVIEERGGTL